MWDKIDIVCWKWNNGLHPKKKIIFGADHVNTLASMLARHMHTPYRLTCITDDSTGIDSSVRIIPLWDDYRDKGGCFVRLKAFSQEMRSLIGPRICSIDLDVVIVRDITSILTRGEDFLVWGGDHRRTPYCGSFWIMNAGCRSTVWTGFNSAQYQPTAGGKFHRGTDQARISDALYPRETMLGTKDGIFNFDSDLRVNNATERCLINIKGMRKRRREELEADIINQQQLELHKIRRENRMLTEPEMVDRLNAVTERVVVESKARYKSLDGQLRRRLTAARRKAGQCLVGGSPHKKRLPAIVKIVFFNGSGDPNNRILQERYSWIRENYK